MNINNPYMNLRDALGDVYFDIQERMHEMALTDPSHDWSTDTDMLELQQQLNVFEHLAKAIEELLFPRVEETEEHVCWICDKVATITMVDAADNIQHWCKTHAIEERNSRE